LALGETSRISLRGGSKASHFVRCLAVTSRKAALIGRQRRQSKSNIRRSRSSWRRRIRVLLFDQPKSVDAIATTVQKIPAAIAEPTSLEGRSIQVTSSLGIATYPSDGTNVDALLANADAAMYRAKEDGRDNIHFYTSDLNTTGQAKLLLQEELRNALVCSEFVLLYQPQVDLRTGAIFAVDALIRWRHPTLGLVPPVKYSSGRGDRSYR
jgi:predicted signal transduction protein with EAL and GGDEF domain